MRFSLSLHPPVCTCRALQPFSADNLGALGVRVPMRAPSDQYPHAGKDTDGLSLQARSLQVDWVACQPHSLLHGSRGVLAPTVCISERRKVARLRQRYHSVVRHLALRLTEYDNLYCAYGSPPLMHWGAPDCVGLTHQTDYAVNVLVGCDLCLSGSHCVDEVSFILVVIAVLLLHMCDLHYVSHVLVQEAPSFCPIPRRRHRPSLWRAVADAVMLQSLFGAGSLGST